MGRQPGSSHCGWDTEATSPWVPGRRQCWEKQVRGCPMPPAPAVHTRRAWLPEHCHPISGMTVSCRSGWLSAKAGNGSALHRLPKSHLSVSGPWDFVSLWTSLCYFPLQTEVIWKDLNLRQMYTASLRLNRPLLLPVVPSINPVRSLTITVGILRLPGVHLSHRLVLISIRWGWKQLLALLSTKQSLCRLLRAHILERPPQWELYFSGKRHSQPLTLQENSPSLFFGGRFTGTLTCENWYEWWAVNLLKV